MTFHTLSPSTVLTMSALMLLPCVLPVSLRPKRFAHCTGELASNTIGPGPLLTPGPFFPARPSARRIHPYCLHRTSLLPASRRRLSRPPISYAVACRSVAFRSNVCAYGVSCPVSSPMVWQHRSSASPETWFWKRQVSGQLKIIGFRPRSARPEAWLRRHGKARS